MREEKLHFLNQVVASTKTTESSGFNHVQHINDNQVIH